MHFNDFHAFTSIILFFACYSFLGWCLESVYRSINLKKWVNPGFLTGPFLPIYGSFALLIILCHPLIIHFSFIVQYLILVFLSTLIEYCAGYVLESAFHMQLWNYHTTPFNVRGRIALPFSLLWGILGFIFLYAIHPVFSAVFSVFAELPRLLFSVFFISYLFWDLFKSGVLLRQLEQFLRQYRDAEYESSVLFARLRPFRRLLATYPAMRHTLSEALAHIRLKEELFSIFVNKQREKLHQLLPSSLDLHKKVTSNERESK